MLALPLRLEDWTIFDANGDIIACGCGLLDSERVKYAAEIVAAVNAQAKLLAAAKEAISLIDGRVFTKEKMKLQATIAAIAAAEEPAP
jgi:hypothetical protein